MEAGLIVIYSLGKAKRTTTINNLYKLYTAVIHIEIIALHHTSINTSISTIATNHC